jgi:DNA repair photolyase
MNAPIIPGLNHHEIHAVIKAAANHGALIAGMTVLRLNGAIGKIFEEWLRKNFPTGLTRYGTSCALHGGKETTHSTAEGLPVKEISPRPFTNSVMLRRKIPGGKKNDAL